MYYAKLGCLTKTCKIEDIQGEPLSESIMKPNQGKQSTGTASGLGQGALSAKALEYYRMYAANEDLPKYFAGDYTDDTTSTTTPTTSSLTTVRQCVESLPEDCASPTSSILSTKSTKKHLEWDSGADIGYAALHALQKSASMPILDDKDPQKPVKTKTTKGHSLAGIPSVSADNSDTDNTISDTNTTAQDLMTYLKAKVGLPVAESTPVGLDIKKSGSDPTIYSKQKTKNLNTTMFNYEVAPSGDHCESNITHAHSAHSLNSSSNDTLPQNNKYFARYRRSKLKNLQIAQPISIECLNDVRTEDGQTQTTHIHSPEVPAEEVEPQNVDNQSIGVQTAGRRSKQEILYLFHPSADNIRFEYKSTSSSTATTTNSSRGRVYDGAFLNCNSFEYVAGNFQDSSTTSEGVMKEDEIKKDTTSSATTISTNSKLVNNSSSTTSTKEVSEEEMEKSLRVMKKLIKSKNYDDKFKQAYIRKMARRLVPTESTPSTESVEKMSLEVGKPDESKDNDAHAPGDWKENVTNSEKLYSSVDTKSTDSPKECLVSFAKRERENQLDWIKSEMEHLAKLKSLLETKKKSHRNNISASVPNIPTKTDDYTKSTAVYMITTEKNGGATCTHNACASRTTKSASGEINFHVHNNLGVRDYRFKEIVTKITPPVVSNCSCNRSDDCFSDRAPHLTPSQQPQQQCPKAACRPCSREGEVPLMTVRRPRDIFPTPPVEAAKPRNNRSRSSSAKSTSITDDTSGYPSRRRPSITPSKKSSHKRKPRPAPACCCSGASPDEEKRKGTSQAKSDSDTESSHYESLTKYPSKSKTTTFNNSSRILTADDLKRVKEVPHSTHHFCCKMAEHTPLILPPLPSTSPKKDSYKKYKAQKLKEKELLQEEKEKKEKAKKREVAITAPPKERERKRLRDRDKEFTSEAEPKSITDDESGKYTHAPPFLEPSKLKIVCSKAKREVILTEKSSVTQPTTNTSTTNKLEIKKRSKTDTDANKHNLNQKSNKSKSQLPSESRTESEVHSFERFTNTEGSWNEDDEDEFTKCPNAMNTMSHCRCAKSSRNMCSCVASKTGTVSLQTVIAPKPGVEKGVMKDEEPKATDAKDVQVGVEKPVMKQKAVGDDVKYTAKEIASQIPHLKEQESPKSGLSITPAAVVTYMPPSGGDSTNSTSGRAPAGYKMVKDLSKMNLSSAVIISSVVTSSVSNPDDNIRRLVLEMPLDEREEDGLIPRLEKKFTKDKEVDPPESDVFSSMLSCSCLQSSSSRVTTTAGSTTEVMCSCCGKFVIDSESSLMLGDNNVAPFCWPCYCASTKRDWNPADPFYQQPDHMCKCYNNKIDDNALEKIRDTLRQLAEIDNQEEAPTSSTKVTSKSDRLVCHSCNKKIKRETSVKKPVAYVLKFEPGEEVDGDDEKPELQSLQEIRVKVPVKNKKACVGGQTTSSGSSKKKRKNGGGADAENKRNLQDYLSSNRPDFVRSAEERRRCLIELAYMREQRCKKYQELLALSNGQPPCQPMHTEKIERNGLAWTGVPVNQYQCY
ncbi:serine-rich adhesin for platelets-like isoform X4 [Atheta coriaria]|uniref:serine-rich adhesin for platelets-like isoform X4 n=1 Tax=Dalotia coriaria TaxID=877792 RepID=UPI0031F3FAB0